MRKNLQWDSPTHRKCLISEREVDVIWEMASRIPYGKEHGKERLKQMQFMFETLQRFKAAGLRELQIPVRFFKRTRGANTTNYAERLVYAKACGFLWTDGVCIAGDDDVAGECRTFQLLIDFDHEGKFDSLDAAIQSRDISFLSDHMQTQVRGAARLAVHASPTASAPVFATRPIPTRLALERERAKRLTVDVERKPWEPRASQQSSGEVAISLDGLIPDSQPGRAVSTHADCDSALDELLDKMIEMS